MTSLLTYIFQWASTGIQPDLDPIFTHNLYTDPMTVLTWNCQGVASCVGFLNACRALIRYCNPDIVFLLKTRVSQEKACEIANKLNFAGYFSLDDELGAGNFIMWHPEDIDVEFINIDNEGIHAKIGPRRLNYSSLNTHISAKLIKLKTKLFNKLEAHAKQINHRGWSPETLTKSNLLIETNALTAFCN